MPNMSYCRFENTYNDLDDCYEVLNNHDSIEELEKEVNQYEKKYIRKLISLCKDIAEEFGEIAEEDSDLA